MHRKRLNFESRSISFQSSKHKESFKRNSVRALKDTDRRPGGFEMILASIDDSFVLLSDLIATTSADNSNLRNLEQHHKFFSANLTDNNQNCIIQKNDKKVDNCNDSIEKSLPQSESLKIAKIDLTGEEIIQWMGGLPIINPKKMLAYFCGGENSQERNKFLPNCEPYKIFSLTTQKQQFNDQTTGNLIREVC
ncbi:unnamed protein product [Cercopithifilaria johnstoni]|uniref:Uncharacterized protein n=1 Tax=Cercopithifilaria johnstoni TaxID=2874296 RepID=A0A8J2MBQ8_9BILA|nr:unnamed protein product [Cercopithifilaria johnstoni]